MSTIYEAYLKRLSVCHNEKQAAKETMQSLDQEDFDNLCEEAERATYDIRSYGHGQFYSYLHHPLIAGPLDPWPASRFPKSVVCMELAKAMGL